MNRKELCCRCHPAKWIGKHLRFAFVTMLPQTVEGRRLTIGLQTDREERQLSLNAHVTARRRSLFKLITGGHGDTQDIDTFSFFNVADETVFVLELIVAQRRRFGSAGFDGRTIRCGPSWLNA
jgi:hypothetical protein